MVRSIPSSSLLAALVFQQRLLPVVTAPLEIELDGQGNAVNGGSNTSLDTVECGLWLAPSTIPNAGLGMYAGRAFNKGEELLRGGDIVIVIVDLENHNMYKEHPKELLWNDYAWDGGTRLGHEGVHDVCFASPGFGSAANSFLPLQNVDQWYPRQLGTGLHRSRDVGAGASTLFHARRSMARNDITAGSELFVTYGEEWFIARTSTLGPVPLTNDLESASELLIALSTVQNTLSANNVTNVAHLIADMWSTFVNHTRFDHSRVLRGSFRHDDPQELHNLQTVYNNDVTAAHTAATRRSLDWLRHHGTCGDHIAAQPSTLPQAGMGAFATRNLPVETIVARLPMIHITDHRRLEMFPLQRDEYTVTTDAQLLINYCYGHAESSLLLCPYGPVASYVNHNQTRANVRLQWGQAHKGNHLPELFNKTVQSIGLLHSKAKLSMEFVATREIREGEEIFLDYGDAWEAKWQSHVSSWQPVPGASDYTSALQLNADPSVRLRTVDEEAEDQQYPDNVQLMCDASCQHVPDAVAEAHAAGTLEDLLWEHGGIWWPCVVLAYRLDENRTSESYVYTIKMQNPDDDSHGFVVDDVPREILSFVDMPYTSDIYLGNSFRHEILIPDEIFPKAWRNIANT